MKKLALLLAFGLLAACGGGGSNSAANAPVGSAPLIVKIKETQVAKEYTVDGPTVSATRRRVVITNRGLDKPTQAFKKFYDYAITENSATIEAGLTFTLPLTSGYTFEFLEYSVLPGGFQTYSSVSGVAPGTLVFDQLSTSTPALFPSTPNILKYDKRIGIDLTVATPDITLTANTAVAPTLTLPATTVTDGSYTGFAAKAAFLVKADFAGHTIPSMYNANNWYLQIRKKTGGVVVIEQQSTITGPNAYVTAPMAWSSNEYQMRGGAIFYLNDSILLPGEKYSKFHIIATTSFIPVVVPTRNTVLSNPL